MINDNIVILPNSSVCVCVHVYVCVCVHIYICMCLCTGVCILYMCVYCEVFILIVALTKAFTFFATHFMELTNLETLYPNVEKLSVYNITP